MKKNKPNIVSNELNQFPKIRSVGYEEKVLKPLQNEIDKKTNLWYATSQELFHIFSGGIDVNKKWKIDQLNLKNLENSISLIEELSNHKDEPINKFISGKNSEKILLTALHLSIIDGFLSIKEDIWDDKKMNAADFNETIGNFIDMVEIKKPGKQCRKHPEYSSGKDYLESMGPRTLIEEVRNGLMHHRYLMCKDGIYINNPEIPSVHKTGFEAFIKREFLEKFLELRNIDRKMVSYRFNVDKPNFNVDDIINSGKKIQKGDVVSGVEHGTKFLGSLEDLLKIKNVQVSDNLTIDNDGDIIQFFATSLNNHEKAKSLLSEFFKIHDKTDPYTIEFALTYIIKDDVISHYNAEKYLKFLINESNGNISYNDLLYKIWKESLLDSREKLLNKLENNKKAKDNIFSDKRDEDFMRPSIEWLTYGEPKDWNVWDSDNSEYLKYIMDNFFKSHKDWKKINNKLKNRIMGVVLKKIVPIKKAFARLKNSYNLYLKLLLNFLKANYIANWYINNPNINVTMKKDPEHDDEHIRNAFAHHNYTILPGVDWILLWDPSRFGGLHRENFYNIEDLYNRTTAGQAISDGLGQDKIN